MASVGRGIVDDAQLFSLAQAADMEIGVTAVEDVALLIPAGSLTRVDMVVEIDAASAADSEDWEYLLADSLADAEAASDAEWWPVTKGVVEFIPVNGVHNKLYARAAVAVNVKWKALGFKRSTRPAALTA